MEVLVCYELQYFVLLFENLDFKNEIVKFFAVSTLSLKAALMRPAAQKTCMCTDRLTVVPFIESRQDTAPYNSKKRPSSRVVAAAALLAFTASPFTADIGGHQPLRNTSSGQGVYV